MVPDGKQNGPIRSFRQMHDTREVCGQRELPSGAWCRVRINTPFPRRGAETEQIAWFAREISDLPVDPTKLQHSLLPPLIQIAGRDVGNNRLDLLQQLSWRKRVVEPDAPENFELRGVRARDRRPAIGYLTAKHLFGFVKTPLVRDGARPVQKCHINVGTRRYRHDDKQQAGTRKNESHRHNRPFESTTA